MLNHGLNHGGFLSLFKLIHWIANVLAYLNSYLNLKAVLALPKTARSAKTHKSIIFIRIVWSTLYLYLCLLAQISLPIEKFSYSIWTFWQFFSWVRNGLKTLDTIFSLEWLIRNCWRFLTHHDLICIANIVCPDLFFCKKLSSVLNKQDQRTMKMAIRIFLAFPSF